jgi:ferrous iron transport protein A
MYALRKNQRKTKRKRQREKHSDSLRLSELEPGDYAEITGFCRSMTNDSRLRELGLIDGIRFRLIKFAPMGDPVEIKIRGYHLSLRKRMANKILVTKLKKEPTFDELPSNASA